MTKKQILCKQCGTTTTAILVRNITNSGISQVFWKCRACNRNATGTYIPHEPIKQFGIVIDEIEIENDYRVEKCAVCGKVGTEYHHFAPRYLFGDQADKWACAYLCKECHAMWHKLVTPNMCEVNYD